MRPDATSNEWVLRHRGSIGEIHAAPVAYWVMMGEGFSVHAIAGSFANGKMRGWIAVVTALLLAAVLGTEAVAREPGTPDAQQPIEAAATTLPVEWHDLATGSPT